MPLERHHVSISGSGSKTVVFAHGFGCDQRVWSRVAPSFERDYRVVLFDLAGCGSPPADYDPARYQSLYGYAEDLRQICAALGVMPYAYVGHSVSGIIGALAAGMGPAPFERLVMLGASPRYLDDPPDYVGGFSVSDVDQLLAMMDRNFVGFARMFAATAMHDHPDAARSQEFARILCGGDADIARRFARVLFMSDHRADLAKVNVATLIMQCADDTIAPLVVGRYLQEHLRQSSLYLIPGSGHCPHISHPDETAALLHAFLAHTNVPPS